MPQSRKLRLLWAVPLLAGAWLTLVTASDRVAQLRYMDPLGSGSAFGAGLAANATFVRAAAAAAAGDIAAAEELARAALEAEPMNQAALTMLGQIALEAGDQAAAERYFLISAQLGWRDPVTQIYWFERALNSGDYQVAAQRAEALLRLKWNDAYGLRPLVELEATPQGRAAIAERMQADPSWAGLSRVRDLNDEQLGHRLALLALLAERKIPVDLKQVGEVARQLFNRGNAQAARQLWLLFAVPEGGRDKLVFDGGFELDLEPGASPFAWRPQDKGGIGGTIEPAPAPLSGRALRVAPHTTSIASVLRQSLVLEAGSYRLSWREAGTGVEFSGRVDCQKGAPAPMSPQAAAAGRRAYRFTVPADPRCSTQSLLLSARGKSASGGEGWLDDVRIEPIG